MVDVNRTGSNKLRPLFAINCKIGRHDYSSNLQRIRVVSSISSMYSIFLLEFLAESENIIRREIFGQDDIKIIITQTYEDNTPSYQSSFNLTYIHSQSIPLKNRPQQSIIDDASEARPDRFYVLCLHKESLANMSTIINRCYQEKFQKTPYEAINDIIEKFLPNMNTDIYERDKNDTRLPRTFNIPRMAFSNSIRYLDRDELGGIYKSPLLAFHSLNGFHMWSLKQAITSIPAYTVHLMPSSFVSDGNGNQILKRTSNNENEFYTRIPIITNFSGQSDVINSGGKTVTTVLPSNNLYSRITVDAESVMKNNVAKTADPTMKYINSTIKNIEKYNFTPGHELNDAFIRLRMANFIQSSSEIIIGLSRNIIFKNLIVPGHSLKLKTHSQDYIEYGGNYITLATDLSFSRRESELYNCNVKIRAARANIKL